MLIIKIIIYDLGNMWFNKLGKDFKLFVDFVENMSRLVIKWGC